MSSDFKPSGIVSMNEEIMIKAMHQGRLWGDKIYNFDQIAPPCLCCGRGYPLEFIAEHGHVRQFGANNGYTLCSNCNFSPTHHFDWKYIPLFHAYEWMTFAEFKRRLQAEVFITEYELNYTYRDAIFKTWERGQTPFAASYFIMMHHMHMDRGFL